MQPLHLAAPFLLQQGVNFRDLRCRNFSMFQDIALLRGGAARARATMGHGKRQGAKPTVTVSSHRINRRSGTSFPLIFLRIEWDVTKQSREGEKRVPSPPPVLPSFLRLSRLIGVSIRRAAPFIARGVTLTTTPPPHQRWRLAAIFSRNSSPSPSSSLPPLRRRSQLFLYLLV